MTRAYNTATTQQNSGGAVNPFVAGKNAIINGDFRFNQRNFTSNTVDSSFNFDRFFQVNSGGTFTVTPQVFTPGAAPVAGYESVNFLQVVVSGSSGAGDYGIIRQRIESVRTFANQTVTVSFWAKATSGTPKIATSVRQIFGSGGSPSSEVTTTGSAVTLSTSWARYSTTISVPSISGKTLGTTNDGSLEISLWLNAGSTYASQASSIGNQNNTFQIWGVQVEAGSVATPFQTATGTLQGELAACQRYYWRHTAGAATVTMAMGISESATTNWVPINNIVPLRVPATSIDISGLNCTDAVSFTTAVGSATISSASTLMTRAVFNTSGQTAKQAIFITSQAAGSYIGLSAEL